jgi:2-polyprenyl-3-methyl-5-hydroxy-6-metoxy-1,4-benzoquinol methylase
VAKAVYRYRQTCRSIRCFPEFQEYFLHYPLKQSKGSSHQYVMQMVGTEQDVIDIGCGEGYLARELKKMKNRISGIDVLPSASETSALDRYYSADLDNGIGSVVKELSGKRFTRALLLDVLEHLKRPEQILDECHDVLNRDGYLIISVPNVANIHVRMSLLFGNFNYTERGLLDKTHLRFFTRKTARKMVESCGYQIAGEQMTVIPVELFFKMPAANPLMRTANWFLRVLTRLFPSLFGYQIMFIARSVRRADGVSAAG